MRRAFVVFLCVAAVYFFLIVPVLNEDKPQSEINGGGEPDFLLGEWLRSTRKTCFLSRLTLHMGWAVVWLLLIALA